MLARRRSPSGTAGSSPSAPTRRRWPSRANRPAGSTSAARPCCPGSSIPTVTPCAHRRSPHCHIAVRDHQLVVHAHVQSLQTRDRLAHPRQRSAVLPGVEQPKLDVRVLLQLVGQLVLAGDQQVVDDQAHPDSALGGAHGALENQPARVVGVSEVGLDVERGHGRVDRRESPSQSLETPVEELERGVLRPVRGEDLLGDLGQSGPRPPAARRTWAPGGAGRPAVSGPCRPGAGT